MSEMRPTYKVTARRWDKGWELHIESVGVTQSDKLSGAEVMVRDLVHRREAVPADSFDIDWAYEVGDEFDADVRAAKAEVAGAAEAQRAAAAKSRAVASRLKASGLSGKDMAAILGVSTQRVSQLLKDRAR